jgi:leucyl-tRNA synthetase
MHSADGMRFALADAGDSAMEDSNFLDDTASNAVLPLYTQVQWIKEVMAAPDQLHSGAPTTFNELVFQSEINKAIIHTDKAYQKTLYRDALKSGFYDLQAARDNYRNAVGTTKAMNKDLVLRFIEVQALLLAPITPHFSEYVWTKLLGKSGSIMQARWPVAGVVDDDLLRQNEHLLDSLHEYRLRLEDHLKPKKKGKAAPEKVPVPNTAYIYVATEYKPWQQEILTIMKNFYNSQKDEFNDKEMNAAIKASGNLAELMKKDAKKIMSFAGGIKDLVKERSNPEAKVAVMQLKTPFDEFKILNDNISFIQRSLNLNAVHVYLASDASSPDPENRKQTAVPGKSVITFWVA